jgi:hypothetical protein
MIMNNDLIIDIELKIVRGMVSLEDLQDILNGEPTSNRTAKYVRELITDDVLTKEQVSNVVSKHIALQENEVTRFLQQ